MRLNDKVTNPGELRTPIKLGQPSLITQPGGFQRKAYTAVADRLAKWTNVYGAEAWTAESVQATDPATVLIRYHASIDSTWGVQKNGQWYDIVALDDILDRHEYIEMKVKRMVGG